MRDDSSEDPIHSRVAENEETESAGAMCSFIHFPMRGYIVPAWASPLTAIAVSLALWAWIVNHHGTRGERAPAVLLLYLTLLLVSTLGGPAGFISLFGIRSWRNALVIIPGALLRI